jgi:hypothetical protein
MTLTEAFQIFDTVIPPDEFSQNLTIDGERLGVPYDCNVPVVLNTQDGVAKLSCVVCKLTISQTAEQWIVTEWGSRGIRLPKVANA